jgi:hypothetical protein
MEQRRMEERIRDSTKEFIAGVSVEAKAGGVLMEKWIKDGIPGTEWRWNEYTVRQKSWLIDNDCKSVNIGR